MKNETWNTINGRINQMEKKICGLKDKTLKRENQN